MSSSVIFLYRDVITFIIELVSGTQYIINFKYFVKKGKSWYLKNLFWYLGFTKSNRSYREFK